jgi:shikimate dehydrogenase
MQPKEHIITCLFGKPVDHSVSDVMFQYFADTTNISNYRHFKFEIQPENIKNAINSLKVLNFSGANITLPYKEKIGKYLHKIDESAKRIGAINTIVNKKGNLIGYNTDGIGAVTSIEKKLRRIHFSDQVTIFGSGGAARAIISEISKKVQKVIILNRKTDISRAFKIKNDFKHVKTAIEIYELSKENIINSLSSNIIINATSVGMYPHKDKSILNKEHFEALDKDPREKLFFDAVFNPFITKFLEISSNYSSNICSGIYMMIYQGIKSFELWTGEKFPEEEVENIRLLLQNTIKSKYEKK